MSDAYEVRIRKGVFQAIDTAKINYELTNATVEQTYFPREDLDEMGSTPKIKVIAVGHSTERTRALRDVTKVKLTLPVQIAIQQKLDLTNTSDIDKLIRLAEQVRETIEDDELVADEDFTWSHTDPLQDEEGNTFSYQSLIQKGVVMVIFTVYYTYIKQP